MAKIQAIRMLPGREPELVQIESGLESLQKEVGGYISLVSLDDQTDVFVNDEGIMQDLSFNCVLPSMYHPTPVVGPLIVVSHDDEGETVGLSEKQAQKWLAVLKKAPRRYISVRAETPLSWA